MRFSQTLLKSYPYVMEMILLYIFWMLLYIHTDYLPPVLPFLVTTGVGAIFLVYFLSRIKSNTPYLGMLFVVLVISVVSSLIGLPFGQSLVIAGISCYRIVIHFHRNPKLSEAMNLNMSLLFGGIIYYAASVQGYIFSKLILYLLVTQLIIFMIGKMLTSICSSSLVMKKVVRNTSLWSVIGYFSGIFVAAIGIALVFPFLFVKTLSYVSSIIGTAMSYAARPFFNAVDDLEATGNQKGESVDPVNWEGNENKDILWEAAGSVDFWLYVSIFGLLVLGTIVYFLSKKRFVKQVVSNEQVYQYVATTGDIEKVNVKGWRPKRQTPQERVRKLFLELEILSAKQGIGRYHYESVTEWLERNQFLDDRLVEFYERVRYGNEVLTADENEACIEIMKQIKARIKHIKKN